MNKQNSKYRWVVFLTALFAYILIVSQRTAPGLITNQIMHEFHLTATAIGLLASIQFMAYAGLQIPIGFFSDRYGPYVFLITGTLLNGIGTILYSIAQNDVVLFLARALVGIGDSAIWINLVLILSIWFKAQEFVGLLGIAGMAGSFGFLLATVPFSALISILNWRAPFFIIGVILCLTGVLLYFVLIKKPKEMEKANHVQKTKVLLHREKTIVTLKSILVNRQAWAAFFCHFSAVGTYIGFISSWAVPYGMDVYGLTRSASSQLIMIGLFGAIIGSPLTSWVASKVGAIRPPYFVAQLTIFLSWGTFLILNGKPPYFVVLILFFIIGYGSGASSLSFAVVRQAFDLKVVGVVSGFANTGGFLSAVLLPSIFGKILDHFQSTSYTVGYQYGFIIPVLFTLLGVVGSALISDKGKKEFNQNGL